MNHGRHRLLDAQRSKRPYRTVFRMTTGQPLLAYHFLVKFWPVPGDGATFVRLSGGPGGDEGVVLA